MTKDQIIEFAEVKRSPDEKLDHARNIIKDLYRAWTYMGYDGDPVQLIGWALAICALHHDDLGK